MKHLNKLALVMIVLFGLLLGFTHTNTYAAPLENPPDQLYKINPIQSIYANQADPAITLGVFGQATQNALLTFQKDHQLPQTGIGDKATLGQLGILQEVANLPLKFGQKGFNVILLQEKLVEQGLLRGQLLPSKLTNYPLVDKSAKVSDASQVMHEAAVPKTHKIKVKATAYTANCIGCSGITETGVNLNAHPNKKVVAVDPTLIPLGSTLYIPGYGEAIAADTGGAIKGAHIDVYLQNKQDAKKWGSKTLTITIVNT